MVDGFFQDNDKVAYLRDASPRPRSRRCAATSPPISRPSRRCPGNQTFDVLTWEFLLTSLIIVASPGTGVIYTLAAGLSRGRRRAWSRPSAVRSASCRISRRRSSASPPCSPPVRSPSTTVKYLGVAYLLYMAWTTWQERGALSLDPESQRKVGPAGDDRGDPDQHPQPEALDLLLRLPAAIRPRPTPRTTPWPRCWSSPGSSWR